MSEFPHRIPRGDHELSGHRWLMWRTGVGRYVWTLENGGASIGHNHDRFTYYCYIAGQGAIGRRYSSKVTAAAAYARWLRKPWAPL